MTDREIFIAAAQIESPSERLAYLDQACGGDVQGRERIQSLLADHDKLGSFLEASPAAVATIEHERSTATERLGMQIGPYKLLQKLGEGGMGAVYLAEQQQPVKRQVALKIIKAGMDSTQVIARFEQERQALAIMDHPHIAKVLDAGTTDSGRLYLVMELVKGIPITRYCDQEHLSPHERLKLFIPVCQAIQHAHQKGIIHRDLKPSNVLIALFDGRPVPKIIDFGVAKATNQKLTERTLFTEVGSIVGTLEYMAPEQAELNNLDIDTRADIYSLGVLLYELLTGAPPFSAQQLRSAGFNEMLRIIKEVEPQKPSTKLSGSAELPSIAANRKLEPNRLTRVVRGDLDWIVMKCLEKERARRYETANAFALDIQRYLDDEPVLAGPPSATYRLQKFLHRHQGPVLAAAVILVLLVGGIIGTTIGLIRARAAETRALLAAAEERKAKDAATQAEADARQQRDQARQAATEEKKAKDAEATQRQNAESVANVLEKIFKELDPRESANDLKGELRKQLAEVETGLDTEYAGEPLIRARLRQTIAWTQFGLGDYRKALALAQQAADERRTHLGIDHFDTLMSLELVAACQARTGQIAKAVPLAEEVLQRRQALLGPDHRETLNAMDNLSEYYMAIGENEKALALLEAAYEKKQIQFGPQHLWTLHCGHNLAQALRRTGQREKALALQEQTVAAARAALPKHINTLSSASTLASWYGAEGKTQQALQFYQQTLQEAKAALGSNHSLVTSLMARLASGYRNTGKYAEALHLYEQLRDKQLEKHGLDHESTLKAQYDVAWANWYATKYSDAAALFQRLHEQQIAKLGGDHVDTLNTLNGLAWSYQRTGKTLEAIELFEQVRIGLIAKLGPKNSSILSTLNGLWQAYQDAKRWSSAVETLQQLVALQQQQLPAGDPRLAEFLQPLGLNLIRNQQFSEAESVLKECLAIRDKAQPDSWQTFNMKSTLGGALVRQAKYGEAESMLIAGYEGLKQREQQIPESSRARRLTEALQRLIDLYTGWEKGEEAAKWRKELDEIAQSP